MAERRMFAKTIIDSDLFLDMPASTQNLYFHLAMRADDDGFVNNPQKIMRSVSCSKNDMDMLVFKQFVIPFESGICVIRHWKIHNYLRSDRHKPTIYTEEKSMLHTDESNSYVFGIPVVNQTDTTCLPVGIPVVDVGKVSIDKDSEGKKSGRFTPPTLLEIESYIIERGLFYVDGKNFFDYFTEGNWTDSKGNKVKSWKQKLLTWNSRNSGNKSKGQAPPSLKPIDPKEAARKREEELDAFRDGLFGGIIV